MHTHTDSIRIYVACLAAYNAGHLHGVWIDATDDVDDIREQIQAMLAASPEPGAEEYAIHDHEGFGDIRLSEYEDLERVHELACAIEEHGEVYALYCDMVGVDYATPDGFQDAYQGSYGSEEDFAYEWWEQAGYLSQIPDNLQCYINWEAVARDLFIDGFMSARDSSHNLHVFYRS